MAKPIKETPTLTGKDAERFSEQIKNPELNRPSNSELSQMRENFEKLNAIAKTTHGVSTDTFPDQIDRKECY